MDIYKAAENFIKPIQNILPRIPEALFTLGIGILIVETLILIVDKFARIRNWPFADLLISIFKFLVRGGLVVFVIYSLGFSRLATAITGSTALLIFFLSTGASQLIADIIAGFFLCSNEDFRIGSRVRAGDKGTEGVILSTDMRKVRIKSDNGNIHVIPNSLVEKNEWVVFEKPQVKKSNRLRLVNKFKKKKED
jgi:small-conductance mechanosensitive channel